MTNGEQRKVEFDECKIDEIFAHLDRTHFPGVAVGIAIKGKPVYRKGFGLACMDLPIALMPSTRLRLASTTKHFTALAYLLLCDEGRARLNDQVGQYLPELNPVTHNVLVGQLIDHSAGLRDPYDLICQFEEHYTHHAGAAQRIGSEDVLSCYKTIDDVNFAPGMGYAYSNGNYLLLTTVIERITGRPLEDVLREKVFEPVGMHDTLLLLSDSNFIRNRGAQHVLNPAGGFERMTWGMDNQSGAGGIVSTIDDMLRWLAHMDQPIIGSTATWNYIRELLSKSAISGLQSMYDGLTTLGASGNAFGGNTTMMKVPQAQLDIMVMSNRQDAFTWVLAEKILKGCLPSRAEGEREEDDKWAGKLLDGVFASPATGTVACLSRGGVQSAKARGYTEEDAQQVVSVGGFDIPARRTGPNTLQLGVGRVQFGTLTVKGNPVQPSSLIYTRGGNAQDELVRVPPSRESSPPVGRFRYEPMRIEAKIEVVDQQARMQTQGSFAKAEFRLQCLGDGIWRATSAGPSRVAFIGGNVVFQQNGDRFLFSNWQTKSLEFRRVV